ncbi:hypothetical protein LTR66_012068, partial [Elasticomyces elasticus]
MRFSTFSGLVSATALLGSADAFWRMSCGVVQAGRIDPLISPGRIAGHAHKISGASDISTSSTYAQLVNSSCTTCEIGDDKSAYWTPQLYYHHKNGSFEAVPNGGHTIYYLGRGDDKSNTKPFPPGFGMVSGDPKLRSYNKTLIPVAAGVATRPFGDRVSFACLTTPDKQKVEQNSMVYTDCQYGLRAQIQFQSCWDGVNLYKADQSHVAYLSRIDNGVCPSTHPVLLPHLFY